MAKKPYFQRLALVVFLLLSGVACQQAVLRGDHDDDNHPQISITMEPVGPSSAYLNDAVAEALEVDRIRQALNGTRYRLLSTQFLSSELEGEPYGPAKHQNDMFRATFYDYGAGRAIFVYGIPFDPETVNIATANVQPLVSSEELIEAARLANVSNEPFQGGMPPTIDRTFANGTSHRVVHLLAVTGGTSKSIFVNLSNNTVEVHPEPKGICTTCSFPTPKPGISVSGVPGTADIYISQGGKKLWEFQAIRPGVSSGSAGSAIELKNVKYKGKTVLFQAGVPILNVKYDPGAHCGPEYRDWQNSEWPFTCDGNDGPQGFRFCKKPATTILDPPYVDSGDFTGVAVYLDGLEVVLKSQLIAGWYRYISEWRFHVDGTLRPRFGFGGTSDCVCDVHHHNVYWRLDFDIESPGNNLVREFNDPPIFDNTQYQITNYEVRRPTDPSHKRHWEISNRITHDTYGLFPGSKDGVLDSYGVGDLWVLRYHAGEIDDSPITSTMAKIDRFLNGELVRDKDVVLWYGAHFTHDVSHGGDPTHIVGPDIRPLKW